MPYILLIQSDPLHAKAVREALLNSGDASFHVEWVRRCSDGLQRLAEEATKEKPGTIGIDAVLVDLFLPDSSGIDTFDRLFRAAPQIPILVLSAGEEEHTAKLAVQRGACAYLLKGKLDSYLLPKALFGMIDRATHSEALFEAKERAQVTLNSIGDAVISTDVRGRVTYLNGVAERMTGWLQDDASGRPFEEVVHIIDAVTRLTVRNPMASAIRENKTVCLTPNCVLVQRGGLEIGIEDSAAPIHDRRGQVSGAVMVFHDVSATRALSLKMSHLAHYDGLTGLPNRGLFNERLTQMMALAHRRCEKLAVLFLDMDRFKHINDSLGHAVGDRVLQSVAQRLLECVRNADTVSRHGGDEFVIALSEVRQVQDAAASADKILLALRAPHRIDEHNPHLSASIGIAIYPDDGTDPETLLRNADFAMYSAKDSGRDNSQFFMPEMNACAVERQFLENGLRRALERQEFVLHYQPQIDLANGGMTGVEALIRWLHPQRGLMLPMQFVPVAEECGLIAPIGRWVLREACRQAKAWQDAGWPPMRIAVNISAVELRAKDFIAGVRTILAETGLDPRYLELELTETFLLQDAKSTAGVLQSLKLMGVQLALDDFGTGYSSLTYLKRFPIDALKIDQSFLRDLTLNPDDASIVSAVVCLGKSLHMRVVAEGVETEGQLTFLKAQGCTGGQGSYFSPAVPAIDFERLGGSMMQPAVA